MSHKSHHRNRRRQRALANLEINIEATVTYRDDINTHLKELKANKADKQLIATGNLHVQILNDRIARAITE